MRGLPRIIAPEGGVVASVMSWLGGWRYFLPAIVDLDAAAGVAVADMTLRTGDLRHVVADPDAHICRMFRWSDLQAPLERAGTRPVAASASNWASLGDEAALARPEADAGRWERFLEHEVTACRAPGALNGGTRILFAAQPPG